MSRWLLLLAAIACEVVSALSLKGALRHPQLYALVALAYPASFVSISIALRRGMPLGVSYAIWGALGVSATAALSVLIFDEALTPLMLGGMALVVAGVVLVQVGAARAAGHAEDVGQGAEPVTATAPGRAA
ncbi:DMT family transporter [Streptomyces fulvoviolaceus]|uniref:DMT family transporter n=1 Tax=Streptomyces fulvoviolaceus TaxID=285535 RepID=UPI000693D6E9|nr:SMR family transporter [Streptomyces fulvoviolaceus]